MCLAFARFVVRSEFVTGPWEQQFSVCSVLAKFEQEHCVSD